MSFYNLEDMEVYKLAERLDDEIWFIVNEWDYFARDTVGKQMARSADSISANIAEGYGSREIAFKIFNPLFAQRRGSASEA